MKVMNLNKKGLFILKIIFLVILFYWVYTLYIDKKNSINFDAISEVLTTKSWFFLVGSFLLSFLNLSIEAIKFQQVLLPQKVSFNDALKSVYAGASTGLLTPDRLGNFIGRTLHLSSLKNNWVISATLLGNFAQLFATILFAVIATLMYPTGVITLQISETLLNTLRFILFPSVFILFLLYYKSEYFLFVIHRIQFLKKTVDYLKGKSNKEKTRVLALAMLRYFIFVLQFYFALNAFGVAISLIATLIFLGFLYLFTTFIPSPFMGNLGTREAIAVLLLGLDSSFEGVVFASLFIWFINVLFPAILGSVFVIKTQDKL